MSILNPKLNKWIEELDIFSFFENSRIEFLTTSLKEDSSINEEILDHWLNICETIPDNIPEIHIIYNISFYNYINNLPIVKWRLFKKDTDIVINNFFIKGNLYLDLLEKSISNMRTNLDLKFSSKGSLIKKQDKDKLIIDELVNYNKYISILLNQNFKKLDSEISTTLFLEHGNKLIKII